MLKCLYLSSVSSFIGKTSILLIYTTTNYTKIRRDKRCELSLLYIKIIHSIHVNYVTDTQLGRCLILWHQLYLLFSAHLYLTLTTGIQCYVYGFIYCVYPQNYNCGLHESSWIFQLWTFNLCIFQLSVPSPPDDTNLL